ncbi:hypothetical protein ASG48_04550 [Aurantimonas sp. Leaf443]|nr:hypothetical protein ASG48_04550 [Aurantimonas sp. Leaf443]
MELLALLLRSDERTRQALILKLDGRVRAALAFFCYNRAHLRSLAFRIAVLCEIKDLRVLGGMKGDLMLEQARSAAPGDGDGPTRHKGVTLARSARG